MSQFSWAVPLLVIGGLLVSPGCGDDAGPATPADPVPTDTIPLDGRGGGVLAYALQPGPGGGVHEIHVMNADGSGDRRIIEASIGLNHHDWSPDGRQLAAVGYVGTDYGTWSVHTFGADGRNLRRLTHLSGVWDNEPSWSPDGSRIAFTRTYPAEGFRSEVWVMNADGSDALWIGVDGFIARWSPDGDRLIYQSSVGTEQAGVPADIMACAVDGSDEVPLTRTDAEEWGPIWSPDGSRIAFAADYDGDFDIYVMEADGSNPRRLTDNDVGDYAPRWSPDGSTLAFSSERSEPGHWEVYVVGVDGSNLRRVTHTAPPRTAINPVWRPTQGG